MAVWYVRDNAPTSTIGWSAVTAWAALTAQAAGVLRRQLATPTSGSERVFVCIVAGTTLGSEPSPWTLTKGAKTAEAAGPTWQECTGQPGVNGDLTNCPNWTAVKNTSPGLGRVIQNNAGTYLFIVSTAGAAGNGAEPSWTLTAGVTTADNTVTWTCIGAVGGFGSWAAPHARLANAFASTWGAAGDSFYLGDDHAETQSGNIAVTIPGSQTSPNYFYSIDHTASLPVTALTAGSSITVSGSANVIDIGGTGYFYGITFNAGSSSGTGSFILANAAGSYQRYEACAIKKLGTGPNNIQMGSGTGPRVDLVNTTLQFGAVLDAITFSGVFTWRNTASALAGATIPTVLIKLSSGSGQFIAEGVDFSAAGSGKTLVAGGSAGTTEQFYFLNCKTNASVTYAAAPTGNNMNCVDFISTAASGITYDHRRYNLWGTLLDETTVVRTGGASDGTTPISWNITTTALALWTFPFECFPISIWNTRTGVAVTVSVYGVWGGGAVPNNDDIWIDVEYFGSASSPLASLGSGTKSNNLATGAPLTTDGSTWGGSTTPFKISVTVTPQLAGAIVIYAKAAKPTSTFYIDPLPVLS